MKTVNSFDAALEVLRGDLGKLKQALELAVYETLEQYAEKTQADARAALNKPHWLLSRATERKVVAYGDTGKTVALAGFERTTRGRGKPGTPDPGIYGRYYQGGLRRDVPAHFLRMAKFRNLSTIPDALAESFTKNVEKIAAGEPLDDVPFI